VIFNYINTPLESTAPLCRQMDMHPQATAQAYQLKLSSIPAYLVENYFYFYVFNVSDE